MKKLFSLLSIVGIIAISNCTRVPENHDPILGIWAKTESSSIEGKNSSTVREEWIFNDSAGELYNDPADLPDEESARWESDDDLADSRP